MNNLYNSISNFLSFDHLVVYGFLLTMLIVGIYVGRKIKNIKEYSVGNRNFGTGVLTLTLLATWIGGGSSSGLAASTFKDGIIVLIAYSVGSLSIFLVGLFIIPKIINFDENDLSMADIMGRFYGDKSKIFTGFMGFIASILNLSAQILALGVVFDSLLGINKITGILIGGGIIILYTSFGGIKSVTITDVLEFIILIVIIPIVANLAIIKAGGISHVLKTIPKEKFFIFKHKEIKYYITLFFVFLFPSVSLCPESVQRLLMARDRKQMKKMFYIQAAITIVFFIMISLIGFAAFIMNPEIASNMALPQTIKTVLPIGLRGFAIAGLLAVLMSSGDSTLNIGGIFLIHNTFEPIFKKLNIKINTLFLIKLATFTIGILAMYIAYLGDDVIKLNYYSISIFSISITIPFIAAIIGMKGDSKSFFIASIASIITFLISNIILGDINLAILSAIIINFITFFAVHLLKNNKFAFIKRSWHEEQELEESLTFKKIKKLLLAAIPTPTNILKYCTSTIKRYGSNHIMFGAFFCINYIVPIFMWNHQATDNVNVMTILRFIGGLLCVGLILEKQWPYKLKRFFPVYWYFTVAFCLPFVSTAMFVLMKGSTEWLVNISLTIMLMAWLIDWKTFIILLVIGTISGGAFGYFNSDINMDLSELIHFNEISSAYMLIYTILFACLIGIIFFRKKDNDIRKKLSTLKLMGGSMAHEVKNVIGIDSSNNMFLTMLIDSMEIKENNDNLIITTTKDTFEKIKELISNMGTESQKGLNIIKRILTNMTENIKENEFKLVNIKETIENAIEKYGMTEKQKCNLNIDIKSNFDFIGSEYYFRHILYNLFKNAYKFAREDCKIDIWTEDNKLFFRDNGSGISKENLPYIFDYFFTTTSSAAGIGLPFSKMVMEKMNGDLKCESETGNNSFTMFIFSFPKKLNKNSKIEH